MSGEREERHGLSDLIAHLREDADFQRSWTDGRRRGEADISPAYRARRLEIAAQRDAWADKVEEEQALRGELVRALKLARGVVASQVETERYLERKAIRRGDYEPDPDATRDSAAEKALRAIRAALSKAKASPLSRSTGGPNHG